MLPLDFSFEFVEQRFIRADSIDKAGDEQCSGRLWTGEKGSEEIAGPPRSPLVAREAGRVEQRMFIVLSIEHSLPVEPVESGYDCGASEQPGETRYYIVYLNFAVVPGNANYFGFEWTQRLRAGRLARVQDPQHIEMDFNWQMRAL